MLPADWEEYLVKQERVLKRAPNPPKRRQPRITRHTSARMRIAGRQTINPVAAAYKPESIYSRTPTKPNEFEGTREVGPGDQFNSNVTWRTGKSTTEPQVEGAKVTPKRPGSSTSGAKKLPTRQGKVDYNDLARKFMEGK